MSRKQGRGAKATMAFHLITSQAMSASTANIVMKPSSVGGTRFLSEADAWTLFRIKSCRFRILGDTTHTVAGTVACCGVVEGVPATIPSTQAQISELLASTVHGGTGQTMWSKWVQVPSAICAGEFPWYQTIIGALQLVESAPFTFCFAGTATGIILLELFWVAEFKGQANTANTPSQISLLRAVRSERELAIRRIEHERIMGVLGSLPPMNQIDASATTRLTGPRP